MKGNQIIELAQLKEPFWTPFLLARALGLNSDALPAVDNVDSLPAPPQVEATAPAPGDSSITVRATNRGGGIGRVVIKVNGAEITRDARPAGFDPDQEVAQFRVDLSNATLRADGNNAVEVTAFPKLERIASERGLEVTWQRAPAKPGAPIALHAIIAGVSSFENPRLDLSYAAKDARDMELALQIAGKGLFPGGVHTHLFANGTAREPTKENLRQAFSTVAASISARAGWNDVLLVYFAGHGVTSRRDRDMYYFLTREARGTEPDADSRLSASTVSSAELAGWLRLKGMPLKQVVILDTCAAGAAAKQLDTMANPRDLYDADRQKAIERVQDATGSHILMGSAADKISYESNRWGQGLLTYALLNAMRGSGVEASGELDVRTWFGRAARDVDERLSRGIGGIQKPEPFSRGDSFPIGFLTPETRRAIPLATEKPQLLRATCMDSRQYPDDEFCAPLRIELRTISRPAIRGGAATQPPFVYLDDLPGEVADSLRPQVIYTPDNSGGLSVRLSLFADGVREPVAQQTISIPTRDPLAAAKSIAAALIAMIPPKKR